MTRFRKVLTTSAVLMAALLLPALTPEGALAAAQQSTDFASQGLGRGYWHVFIAYALAWVLVLGWAISIGRRLADVERRLPE